MKHLVTFSTSQPPEAAAEFRVGVGSVPYLADHGFQDMVVLPGSFYIEMALYSDHELFKRVPGLVRNVSFHNPIILSAEDTVIKLEVRDRGDGRVEYTFYEAGLDDGSARPAARRYAAKLEIDRNPSTSPRAGAEAFSIETFQAQSQAVIAAARFYETLRENGNQYGPGFQNVASIWRAGDQSLGKLAVTRQHAELEPHYLHPSLLDSMIQLLAPFIMERGKTFVLQSIESIDLKNVVFPETLWGHATRVPAQAGNDKEILGNVRVFGASGEPYLELFGVTLTLLDRDDAGEQEAAANLVIAGNFTAEPLEDIMNFWGNHFGVALRTEFAPYNQIFQQLLDTGSAFRRNRDGANVILVGLEEWIQGDASVPMAPMSLERERAERCFGTRARYVLPNGLEIVHLNRYETDYVYHEIFVDQCYLRHDIRLPDGGTVLDIGANIGLFSLFVMSRCANARIYACEPAPVVFDLLKANCDAYGTQVQPLNVGVSDRKKTATFTFYEKSSVFSGFHSDVAEDREAIRAVVRNMLSSASVTGDAVEEYVDELTADRLDRKTYECQLTSVSDIIREHQIEKIDLLKVDAEKSELAIIKGIADSDWPKIDQIVMEIHDPTRVAIQQIENFLIDKGYRCAVEQETLLEHAGLFNLYATRATTAGETRADAGNATAIRSGSGRVREAASSLQRNVQDFCAALRSFAGQSKVPVLIGICPRTPAAAADAELGALLDTAETTVLSAATKLPNVHTFGSESLLRRYPVKDYYDPDSHHVAHIPYTPACYAAIGTALVRAVYNLKRSPFKVIALDCDNTLWKGVCGEDGPLGVEITAPHRALQEFMIAQMRAGMLLCLCSKNNEQDVLDVFEQRGDMPLKREHLVAWRLNWHSKSENIRALARELNLGLDSFIFIDDNPVECADVGINCPGVLTLQLPGNADSFPSFLDHVWAFDHLGSTQEDQKRTRMYQETARREQYREQALSLKDFIKGLQLRIDITEPTEEQLDRVSQLTFRTNQFNFTTLRRAKNEIQKLLERADANCMVVRVADRFGDYGLVGVLIYEIGADRYKVDTLLLSCRVLGRGVEHSLVARLGQWAVKEGKKWVEFIYAPTAKNVLALEFITRIGGQYRNETNTAWMFPAERLAKVEYNPDENTPLEGGVAETEGADQPAARTALTFDIADRSERLQAIAENLFEPGRITKAIDEHRRGNQPASAAGDTAPGTALETALLNIWRKILGRPRIGTGDNFFEAGGTSLRAVQVIAAIKKELQQTLSIVSLFECPTVALLAARLSAPPGEVPAVKTAAAATLRGQQRRYNTMRQKRT